MASSRKMSIAYVTSNPFKREENDIFAKRCRLSNGSIVGDKYGFDIREVPIREMLEVDLSKLVRAEVASAYGKLRIPCIVEHAGLVFEDYRGRSYPGGLTKPMWDTLGDQFITETNSNGRRAIARAVVAYCDGMTISTFVGETSGTLADAPRGDRRFYWDTVFIPDDPAGKVTGKTYAEIVADTALGLAYKIEFLSQSSRAMLNFLNHLENHPIGGLWKT